MPLYTWKCDDCSTKTEVIRSIKDIDQPPDDGCEACNSRNLTRIIPEWKREQSSLVWGGSVGWHDENYSKYKRIREK